MFIPIHLMATKIDPGQLPTAQANQGQVDTILVLVFQTIGAFALLMIVVSGFRYVLSAGDAQKTKQAREGIIFSLIGLAIAIIAVSIVSFIGNRL